ncbi:ead/Ea22-like family protein, partial [Salmonella enterica]
QALREAAERAMHDDWGYDTDIFHEQVTPSVVLALLDECAALAAENELARKAVQSFCDVVGDNTEVISEEVGRDGVLVILEAMKATGNMPATDAFLAEVRASGVDAAIEHLHKKFGGTGHIGVPVMALEWLAQEIRKGGAA